MVVDYKIKMHSEKLLIFNEIFDKSIKDFDTKYQEYFSDKINNYGHPKTSNDYLILAINNEDFPLLNIKNDSDITDLMKKELEEAYFNALNEAKYLKR